MVTNVIDGEVTHMSEPAVQASPDLNEVRDRLLASQRGGGATGTGLFVDRAGKVMLGEQVADAPTRSLSAVTGETFYAPDLNAIAATIRNSQATGNTDPARKDQQLYVDKAGGIRQGDQVNPNDPQLSRVTQETFYYTQHERTVAANRLPAGTYEANDGQGIEGWVSMFTNDFGDSYTMFYWLDPTDRTYKASLIKPELAGIAGVHDCHIFADGTICLKESGGPGYRNLEDTYARSVVWSMGASCYRRGYGFQFNIGQTG